MTSSSVISTESTPFGEVRRSGQDETPWLPIGLIVVPSVAAWVMVAHWAGEMGNSPGPMGLDLWRFLGVWLVMMAAMMLPSLTVARFARGTSLARGTATEVFALGYLVVWIAVGIICFPVSEAFASLVAHHHPIAVATAVAVFGNCAVYQSSGLKWRFLERCCPSRVSVTPLTDPFRQGVRCGANCLGASWLAMSLLVVVGLMQLEGMAVIGLLLLSERHAQRRSVSVLFSLAALAYGIAIAFDPNLIPALPAGNMVPMGTMK